MIIHLQKLFGPLFLLLIFNSLTIQAQRVTINSKINGFRHNWDCCQDGTIFGCVLGSQPEPRYQVKIGYNGGSFIQSTNGPGLASGCTITYGSDDLGCSIWNPGIINMPVLSGVNALSLSVNMRSWEYDGGLPCCGNNNCNPNGSGGVGGFPCNIIGCFNPDDVICGETRIADIDYWVNPPDCVDYNWNGEYTSGSFLSMTNRCGNENGAGYGINQLRVNWTFFDAPTIVTQPDAALAGGAVRTVCANFPPPTLSFTVNSFKGWTLGRNVRWEKKIGAGAWTQVQLSGPNNETTTYTFTPVYPGIAQTEYYRAIISSDCGNTFTKSVTTNEVTINWLSSSNASCVPASCGTVYVDPNPGSGLDQVAVGAGTASNPYQTISYALSKSPTYIRVAKGNGTDLNICNLLNNVVIEGGYIRTGGNWQKSSNAADVTNITFSGIEKLNAPNTNIAHLAAFKSDGKTGWAIKDINITTANVAANQFAQDGVTGLSNYGILINNSSDYMISRCNITIGNAGNGKSGVTPAAGGGGAGGAGGSGSGGCEGSCSVSKGGNGIIGGGIGSPVNSNGGAALSMGIGCFDIKGSIDGNSGTDGANGYAGANGSTNTSSFSLTGSYFIPGLSGANGVSGGGGQGGGGGSGNIGGGACAFCGCYFPCNPLSGGAGGAGGAGGTGGIGGGSGGGAFGIWRKNSTTSAILIEVNVSVPGNAGTGGTGAVGSNGLTGSNPPAARPCNTCEAFEFIPVDYICAGDGGKGGTGGKGGNGANGIAGTKASMITDGVASTLTTSPVSPSTIYVDYFSDRIGTSGNITGVACKNSEIDLRRITVGAPWSFSPAGLTIVNDLRDLSVSTAVASSYTINSATVKVTTDNSDIFYDLTANGNTFANGLYVKNQSPDRVLPDITTDVIEICEGGTATNTVAGWDVTNIAKREWLVYDSALVTSSASSPLFPANTTATPIFGPFPVLGVYKAYIVRYRELHSCCGWSRPVFSIIRVFPLPTKPTVIPNPNQLSVCPGSNVSATFTTGTLAVGCTLAYEYMMDGNGTWITYTPGSNITTVSGNTSVSVRARKVCSGVSGNNCDIDIDSTYEWRVLPPADRGTLEPLDQIDTAALCGSPTPSARPILFQTQPAGASGYTYQWYYKEVAGTTAPTCPASLESTAAWTLIPGATFQTYIPSSGEVPAGYSRTYAVMVTPVVSPGFINCSVANWANSCRKITVLPVFNTGTISTPDQTYCSAGTAADPTTISVNPLPQGAGGYTYQWYYKVASGTPTPPACPVAGTGTIGWTSILGETSSSYDPPSGGLGSIANGNSNTYACFVTPNAGSFSISCGTGDWSNGCGKVTVLPAMDYGTILSGDQNLCFVASSPPVPNPISSSIPEGSGGFTYQWYYQTGTVLAPPACPTGTSTIGWTPISGATGLTYSPTGTDVASNTSKTFALFVTPVAGSSVVCGTPTWAGSCRKVIMNPPLTVGTIQSTGQTICSSADDPGVIGELVAPLAGSSIQWYQKAGIHTVVGGSPIDGSWTSILGATANTYDPPAGISADVTFARAITPPVSNPCVGTVWSIGTWVVKVAQAANKGIIDSAGQIICAGGDPVAFGFTTPPFGGLSGNNVLWYSKFSATAPVPAPTPGATPDVSWTSTGITTQSIDLAVINTVGYYTYACAVDNKASGGVPDCDGLNNYQWATGRYVVTVVADPTTTPTATPIPATVTNTIAGATQICFGQNVTLINPIMNGGIASVCKLQYSVTKNSTIPGAGTATSTSWIDIPASGMPLIDPQTILPPAFTNTQILRIYIRTTCSGLGCVATGNRYYAWVYNSTNPVFTTSVVPTSLCDQGSVTLTASVLPASTIAWYRDTVPNSFSGTLVTSPNGPLGIDTWYFRARTTTTCVSYSSDNVVTVVADPIAPTLNLATPLTTETVCIGGNVKATFNAGSAGLTCTDSYQYSTNGGTSWTPYNPNTDITATEAGVGKIIIQGKRDCSGVGCDGVAETFTTLASWNVADLPSAANTKSPNLTDVCEGATLTLGGATVVTGGAGNCTTEYRTITPSGTSAWGTSIPVIFDAAIGNNQIQIRRTCDGSGCGAAITTYSWNVVADPVAPTLLTATPANTSGICVGGIVSATFNAGSAGLTCTDQFRSSINGMAGPWSSYTPGNTLTALSANDTIIIQGRRDCSGTACDGIAETYSTLAFWPIESDPVAPTATMVPTSATVCEGQILSLSNVTDAGGGAGICSLEYSTDGGSSWSATLTPYPAVIGSNTIKIRKSCTGNGCGIAETSYTWNAVAQPAIPGGVTKSPNTSDVCVGQVLSFSGSPSSAGGTGTCIYEYSVNGAAYTSTFTPFVATLGANTISIRKNCDGTGCNESVPLTLSWNVYEDPETPTATQSPSDLTVCSGSVLTLTGVTDNGGGIGTCTTLYQTITPSGTSAWTSGSVPSLNTSTVGDYSINVRKYCNGSNCDSSAISSYTWTVVDDPTLAVLPDIIYCKGYPFPSRLRAITNGGTGSYTFTWQHSLDNSTWFNIGTNDPPGITYSISSAATNSTIIITGDGTEAADDYYYRCLVVSTSSSVACNVTTNVSKITANEKPVITNPVPATQTTCLNTTPTDISVTASSGSANPYSYIWYVDSVNLTTGGILFDSINPITPSVTDTGTYYYYVIVTQSGLGCNDTSNTAAEVVVIDAPVFNSVKTPNVPGVCEGNNVSATVSFSGGSGCTDVLQIELDSSGVWNTYTSGTSVSTTGRTLIKIRAQRGSCGCASPMYYIRWSVNDKPTATPATAVVDNYCGSITTPYANLTANSVAPYAGTWTIQSGPGTIERADTNMTRILNMTPNVTTTVRWLADNNGCSDSVILSVTPPVTTLDPNTIATVDNCRNCIIRNGNVYTYYNASGHIIAKVEDFSSPTVALGLTEVCLDTMAYTSSNVPTVFTSMGDFQPYLPRRWSVSPTTNPSASHVTLYFKKSEFDALQTAAIGSAYQFSNMTELTVTKFSGGSNGTMTDPPVYPAQNLSAVLMNPTVKRYPNLSAGPDYSIEFDVSTYSTFYVHPNRYPFAPLPVDLLSFTGWNQDNINVLNWSTASESNTLKFEIHKSIDNGNTWTVIGENPAAGNSNQILNYDFNDLNPTTGDNYYKLKIVDIDNQFTYSNTIDIYVSETYSNMFTRVYPNPTGGKLNVEIQSTAMFNTTIELYDVVGSKISDKLTPLNKGINTVLFDFSLLPHGAYILQFTDIAGVTHKTKFIKD